MKTKLSSMIGGAAVCLLTASVASAQYAEPPPPAYGGESAGVREHDGFYLRLAPQLGYLTSSVSVDGDTRGVAPDVSLSGVGIGGELALGGTIAPGFVLGGALSGMSLPDPTVKFGDQEFETSSTVQLSVINLFADWYPDARGGFHVQGVVGFGVLSAEDDDGDRSDDNPSGLVIGAGAGYEWWIGEQWSAGLMGRVLYAPLTYSEGDTTLKYSTFVPSLMGTFTFH